MLRVCAGALCTAGFALGCEFPTTESRGERYSVEIVGQREDLVTGEIVEFAVVPRRNGEVVPVVGAVWTSAEPAVLEFVDRDEGLAIARGVGATTIEVSLGEPRLSDGRTLRASAAVQVVSEVFYGAFSRTTVRFGDTVTVLAPEGQEFGDATLVFVTGTASPEAFTLLRTPRVLSFVVPAGTQGGPVTFTDLGPAEKTLASRSLLVRDAGDDDVDRVEPNDSASTAALLDSLTFDLFLSLHEGADIDWLTVVPSQNREVTLSLDWKASSELDLWIYNDKLEVVDSTTLATARPETVTRSFPAKPWFFRIARRDTTSTEPVSYRLTAVPTR